MVTNIYFIRHAQPNLDNHDDFQRELSDKGLQDCQLLTQYFKQIPIHAILSSPYKRAYDTLKPLAKNKHLSIQTDSRFRERKITSEWIKDFDTFAQKQWADFSYHLPAGESLQDVQIRMLDGLTEALHTYPDKTIVIGSHGTAISSLIHYFYPDFGYRDFFLLKDTMPFILKLECQGRHCLSIDLYNVFTEQSFTYFSNKAD
ncbi:histidine phosphatase family protein [Streptococcus cuniculipharyngis]|uniref:Histidine phosphatase family protein n=1 Tax=Streptococcus cuniculipharyngis TaxID=1562651 RepID=A0A5C5SBF4_9STRE|nr:histidine phosphatase family protein [Streptococcus cuniculipharyngis]TWS97680.1 histidine phosphatase family protein [Streptococcus cuniculipharyngis]